MIRVSGPQPAAPMDWRNLLINLSYSVDPVVAIKERAARLNNST